MKVETRGGSLAFSSIAATIVATTGGGLIRLDDLAGPVKISSGGGNVEAGNLGGSFSVTSGAADVHVNNVAGEMQVNLGGGRVYVGTTRASSIQTGAGSIQVQKCFGDLHVASGGGNLNLGDVDGAVVAETDGGSVRLASARGPVTVKTGGGSVELYNLSRGAQVETGAGPITVEFVGMHGFTDSFLHTASGDVTVCFSSSMPVTVHATSDMASGRGIWSDFPGLNITKQGGNMVPMSMFGRRRAERRRAGVANSYHHRADRFSQMSIAEWKNRVGDVMRNRNNFAWRFFSWLPSILPAAAGCAAIQLARSPCRRLPGRDTLPGSRRNRCRR